MSTLADDVIGLGTSLFGTMIRVKTSTRSFSTDWQPKMSNMYLLQHPQKKTVSRSSKRPLVYGTTPSGEYIVVVLEEIDDDTVYPITAYVPDED